MEKDLLNKDPFKDEHADFLAKVKVPWQRTKEDVWSKLSGQLQEPQEIIQPRNQIAWWKIAAAAVVILTFGVGIFMRTYTNEATALAGQHTETMLPDGSKVWLNAQSSVSYQPYWWWAKREVALNGEAFFEVKKGEKFGVVSESGRTEVLGTSFNVFARGEKYKVTCVTGKVKVRAKETAHSVILHPSEKVELENSGQLKLEKNIDTNNVKAWISNRLLFTSLPIQEVFEEIERQYKVRIIVSEELALRYTGNFEKGNSVNDALNLICKPFQLSVKKEGKNSFRIVNNK